MSRHFFDGKEVTIIPTFDQNYITLKFGEEEKPIHEIGDGLQQVILITYLAFLNKRKTVFFVEEPELYLHAGLQRQLVEAMRTEEFRRHTYVFSTHSNHFLDLVFLYEDIKLLSVIKHKVGDHEIQEVKVPRRDLLVNLGVRDSSVFLTNATIWVEGVHDRRIIQALLDRYQECQSAERYHLNKHYTIVEYGGANLPHFLFDADKIELENFRGNNFFVFDGDVESNKGWTREEIAKSLGGHFHILDCKEIENTVPRSIFCEIMEERWSKNTKMRKEFDTHGKDILSRLGESRALSEGEFYKKRKSGNKFESIAKVVEEVIRKYREDSSTSDAIDKFSVKSEQTIKNKEQFSASYSRKLRTWDGFDEDCELKNLAADLYEFIKEVNQ